MIKLSCTLIGAHADEWTGEDAHECAAILEARVGAAIDALGMAPETAQSFRETFLKPVAENLRTAGRAALLQGKAWNTAAGPILVAASPIAKDGGQPKQARP
ncbi:hypothetical protein [Streptomyces sp. NPDC059757]|uniref:hypothetical protein n=1 Tax=Streptomyces sp. NPDC059757 TaxID=3346935 RepID=UPI0036490597